MKPTKYIQLFLVYASATLLPINIYSSALEVESVKKSIIEIIDRLDSDSEYRNIESKNSLLAFYKLPEIACINILKSIEDDANKKLALIKVGMTREEVEAILLSGDWVSGVSAGWLGGNHASYVPKPYSPFMNFGSISLWFDWKDIRPKATRKKGERLYNASPDQQVTRLPVFNKWVARDKAEQGSGDNGPNGQ